MTTIKVTINSLAKAKKFLYIAKNMKFVDNAWIEPDNQEPLTDEDWIKPGRPATDAEIEARLTKIENEILDNKLISFEDVKKNVAAVMLK